VALTALLLFGLLGPLAPQLRALIALLQSWPGLSLLALGLLLGLRQRAPLQRFERHSREGWTAALPVCPALQRAALRRCVLQQALLQLGLGAAGLLALTMARTLPLTGLSLGLGGLLVATLLGAGLGWVLRPRGSAEALTRGTPLPSRVRAWTTAPRGLDALPRGLIALPRWLGPLPQLAQWQRRDAIRAWRGGRGWVWLLPLWLMIPAGEAGQVLLGLALFGAGFAWLRNVLDASARALGAADRVLAATPYSSRTFCRSVLPYPLSRLLAAALACAGVLAALGAGLAMAMLAATVVIALGGLELSLSLRFPRSRARQRLRLLAESTLLVLLAQQGLGALALLLAFARAAWHLHRARNRR